MFAPYERNVKQKSVCMTRLSCSVDSVVSLTNRGITGSADHHETGTASNIPKSINVNHSNSKKRVNVTLLHTQKLQTMTEEEFLFQRGNNREEQRNKTGMTRDKLSLQV